MTTDPFDALRGRDPTVEPDPDFVARLEARLLAAVPRTDRPHDDPPTDQERKEYPMVNIETVDLSHTRRRRAAVAAAAVASAAAVIAGLVIVRSDGSSPNGPAATTSAPIAAALPPIGSLESAGATAIPLADRPTVRPTFLTAADGVVWLLRAGAVGDRIDAATGTRQGDLPVATDPFTVGRPVVAFGSVWVRRSEDTVVRVDARTGTVAATVTLPDSVAQSAVWMPDIVVAPDGIWTITVGERYLVRIDPATNAVADRHLVGADALSVGYGDGSLWVSRAAAHVVSRIDPADGRELARIDVPVSPEYIVVGDSGVWVSGNRTGPSEPSVLVRIDPTTNRVVADVVVSDEPTGQPFVFDLAVGGGYVWTNAPDAQLVQVDATTNTVVARYGSERSGGAVAVDGNVVWVTVRTPAATLYRLPIKHP